MLVTAVDLLLRINCTQSFLTYMNSTIDFSYISTPQTSTPIHDNTTAIPRSPENNPKLPIFLDGRIVWGGLPKTVCSPFRLMCDYRKQIALLRLLLETYCIFPQQHIAQIIAVTVLLCLDLYSQQTCHSYYGSNTKFEMLM